MFWTWLVLVTEAALCDDPYLSPDKNTVFLSWSSSWFSKLPAGEADCGLVTPVKQAFCLLVIESNPKLVCGSYKQEN